MIQYEVVDSNLQSVFVFADGFRKDGDYIVFWVKRWLWRENSCAFRLPFMVQVVDDGGA